MYLISVNASALCAAATTLTKIVGASGDAPLLTVKLSHKPNNSATYARFTDNNRLSPKLHVLLNDLNEFVAFNSFSLTSEQNFGN